MFLGKASVEPAEPGFGDIDVEVAVLVFLLVFLSCCGVAVTVLIGRVIAWGIRRRFRRIVNGRF